MTPNIVFCGTPPFAAKILTALVTQLGYSVSLVITRPDKPRGRGRKITPSAVSQIAQQYDLPLIKAEQNSSIPKQLLQSTDLMIVAAFGVILAEPIFSAPKFGTINIHTSLLPSWRGASPIQHAILHGDQITGVSFMQLSQTLDAGDIIAQYKCPISPCDTAGTLEKKLCTLSIEHLGTIVEKIITQQANLQQQDTTNVTYAPTFYKKNASLDWQESACQLSRKIRAFNPFPIADGIINTYKVKVWQAKKVAMGNADELPGKVLQVNKHGMLISTGDGKLRLEIIQFPGKKPQTIADLINGRHPLLMRYL